MGQFTNLKPTTSYAQTLCVITSRTMRLLLTILVGTTLLGCKDRSEKIEKDFRPQIWRTIFFDFGSNELTVYNDGDSLVLKSWTYKDSVTEKGKVWIPIGFKTKKESVNQMKKDSIYFWTTKINWPPVMPVKFCTDYVGSLKVKIQFGDRVFQTSEFYSICEWETMSTETGKLHRLFSEKFPELK
jgi:hypothetical protein